MLATGAGPALGARRRRAWIEGRGRRSRRSSVTVPALVYGYELVGSVKEITALPMILTLGALVVAAPRAGCGGPPPGAIPFALVAAAGVSALGAGFGAWVLAAAVVVAVAAIREVAAGRRRARPLLLLSGAGALVLLLAGLADVGRTLRGRCTSHRHRLDRQRRQPAGAVAWPRGVRRVDARTATGSCRRAPRSASPTR